VLLVWALLGSLVSRQGAHPEHTAHRIAEQPTAHPTVRITSPPPKKQKTARPHLPSRHEGVLLLINKLLVHLHDDDDDGWVMTQVMTQACG